LVARRVAEVHPERVARLVLLGAPEKLGDNQEELALQQAVRGLQDPVPERFARELQGAAAHVALPEPFFERLIADSLKLPARVWRSTLDGLFAFDDAAELGRITAPTLLIWGEWDQWLPREEEEDQLAVAIPRGQGGRVPGDGPQPELGAPGAGCRRPGRLHAPGVADSPPQDPLRGGTDRRNIERPSSSTDRARGPLRRQTTSETDH
jgi:non-heme chloroperoxidase